MSQVMNKLKSVKKSEIPAKVEDKSKKWISYQINIFRIALLVLAYKVAQAEERSLSAGGAFSFNRLWYIILIFVCVIILYRIEQWDRREASTIETEKEDNFAIRDLKSQAYKYVMNTLLPEAKTSEDKFKILGMLPDLISQTSTAEVKRTIAENFQAMVEAFNTIFTDMHGSTKKFQLELKGMMDKIMSNPITPRIKETISDEDLLPAELLINEKEEEEEEEDLLEEE